MSQTSDNGLKGLARRLAEGALGNAIYTLALAALLAVLALFATCIRHVRDGTFLESALWFVVAFALTTIFVIAALFALLKLLGLPRDATVNQSQTPIPSTIEAISTPASPAVKASRSLKPGVALLVLALLLVFTVAIFKWHQYVKAHRMWAEVKDTGIGGIAEVVNVTVICVTVHVVNDGPDSIPFNWRMTVKLPTGRDFDTEVVTDWNSANVLRTNHTIATSIDLLNELSKGPLRHGKDLQGLVIFLLPGIPNVSIPFGTKFLIRFEDGQGHTIITHSEWTGPVGVR